MEIRESIALFASVATAVISLPILFVLCNVVIGFFKPVIPAEILGRREDFPMDSEIRKPQMGARH